MYFFLISSLIFYSNKYLLFVFIKTCKKNHFLYTLPRNYERNYRNNTSRNRSCCSSYREDDHFTWDYDSCNHWTCMTSYSELKMRSYSRVYNRRISYYEYRFFDLDFYGSILCFDCSFLYCNSYEGISTSEDSWSWYRE